MTLFPDPPVSGTPSYLPETDSAPPKAMKSEVLLEALCRITQVRANVSVEGHILGPLAAMEPVDGGECEVTRSDKSASQGSPENLEDIQQQQGISGPGIPGCPVANSTADLTEKNIQTIVPYPRRGLPSQDQTSR